MLFKQFKSLFTAKKLLFQASDHLNLQVDGIYSGFDPTASSLHIGNIIPILGLVLSGKNGIKPYSLIGSATTLIGDPSGRKLAKEMLSESEIKENAIAISNQIKRIYYKAMELSGTAEFRSIDFVDNIEWFKDMKIIDFLSNMGRFVKVNTMLSRNCVQSRLSSEDGLNFCELSYQLMQGYDFFYLHKNFGVNVQIGGSDQWGNMISGSEFIWKKFKKEAAFITLPLLTNANGVKMGKSSGNGIWLDPNLTCIYDFYQYFASLSELDANHILPLLTACDSKSTTEILHENSADPSAHVIQKHLANYMTTLVHNEDLACQAKSLSELLFSSETDINLSSYNFELLLDSSRFKKLRKSSFKSKELTVFEFLKHIFTEFSNNQIRQIIKSGGFRLNRNKIVDASQNIRLDELKEYNLINNGKTYFVVLKLEY